MVQIMTSLTKMVVICKFRTRRVDLPGCSKGISMCKKCMKFWLGVIFHDPCSGDV